MMLPNAEGQSQGEILVVEDNRASMKLLVGILADVGFAVRPAGDGELGLRSVQAKKPDLILLDFKLPGIDGIEVCRRLRKDPETREIPVIFVSALEDSQLKVQALQAGAVDYVTKPIDAAEVLARIATHLNISRLQRKTADQATELAEHRRHLEQLVVERTGELEASERKFRSMFETSADGIVVVDADSTMIVDVNAACETVYGYTKDEFLKLNVADILHEPEKTSSAAEFIAGSNKNSAGDCWHRKKDGTVFPVDFTAGRFTVDQRKFVYGFLRDTTDRKADEANIAASLREKEVLLREIHHRVKNNMQVIASLLRMHSRRTQNEQMRLVFGECRDRINAMSLIHEALYESDNIARIDFHSYLEKLCRYLNQAYSTTGHEIEISLLPSAAWLSMDQSVAVGMVVCELVSNAFKHAFTNDQPGVITIELAKSEGDEIRLTVQDNGVGLPAAVDFKDPKTLGLDLVVSTVTGELGGEIDVTRTPGTKYVIRFDCASSDGKDY